MGKIKEDMFKRKSSKNLWSGFDSASAICPGAHSLVAQLECELGSR